MMALQRAVEDRMVSMYRQGELLGSLYTGHWHEAIAVGTAAALRQDDFLCPLHRDMGAHLWRGMEPWQVMASFLGKATAPTGGRDGTLHYGRLDLERLQPAQPHPGQLPGGHRRRVRVQVPRRGPGGAGVLRRRLHLRGDFHEALNIAAVMNLPCIFIVENNQYSYSTPLSAAPPAPTSPPKRPPTACPARRWTAPTCSPCTRRPPRAVARARAGEGPSLIECVTMRMHGHAEHDPADYVPRELFEEWAQRDPVELFAATAAGAGVRRRRRRRRDQGGGSPDGDRRPQQGPWPTRCRTAPTSRKVSMPTSRPPAPDRRTVSYLDASPWRSGRRWRPTRTSS